MWMVLDTSCGDKSSPIYVVALCVMGISQVNLSLQEMMMKNGSQLMPISSPSSTAHVIRAYFKLFQAMNALPKNSGIRLNSFSVATKCLGCCSFKISSEAPRKVLTLSLSIVILLKILLMTFKMWTLLSQK